MQARPDTQRGAALVMAVLLLVVLGILLAGTVRFVVAGRRASTRSERRARHERALDAGLARVRARLAQLADESRPRFSLRGTNQGVAYRAECVPLGAAQWMARVRIVTDGAHALRMRASLRRDAKGSGRWSVTACRVER